MKGRAKPKASSSSSSPSPPSASSPPSGVHELPTIKLYPYINWGRSATQTDRCVECPNGTLLDTNLAALGSNAAENRCWGYVGSASASGGGGGAKGSGSDGGGGSGGAQTRCGGCVALAAADLERLRAAMETGPSLAKEPSPHSKATLCAERERAATAAGFCARPMQVSVPTKECARRYPSSWAVDHWVMGHTWGI